MFKTFRLPHLAAAVLLACGPLPAAGQLATGDATIKDQLCVGEDCVNDPTGTFVDALAASLMLVDPPAPASTLFDTSLPDDGFPFNDWGLIANDNDFGGLSYLGIQDKTGGTMPFRVMAGAPEDALVVGADGKIGIGTMIPEAALHIMTATQSQIILEQIDAANSSKWRISGAKDQFVIRNQLSNMSPFIIHAAAPTNSFKIQQDGWVGLGGTASIEAPLHISDDNTFSFFRITATGAPTNKSVDIVFTQGPLTTGELRYNIVDGDGPEMRLNANGDMTLTGTLTTAGPECSTGCDRVFAPDYPLASIEDHAAAMWAAGYLPALGPTVPGAPVNVTDKLGDVINELEHAHIYIAQLQGDLAAQRARNESLEATVADILVQLGALRAATAPATMP